MFEKEPALGIPAGGLRVPPNMSKILKAWAGPDELARIAVLNVGTPWHNRECACGAVRCAADGARSGDGREDGLRRVAARRHAGDGG